MKRCGINPQIGDGTEAAKVLHFAEPEPGLVRTVVAGTLAELPQAADVLACDFAVQPNAPAGPTIVRVHGQVADMTFEDRSLRCRENHSDSELMADEHMCQKRGGTMSRIVTSFMRTTVSVLGIGLLLCARVNAQACLGDCNGNGSVSPGELTKIIAIIGLCDSMATGCGAVAGGCVNADKNGNGTISAGELTNIISNILNFPNGCAPAGTPGPTATNPVALPTNTPAPTSTQPPTPTPTPGAAVCGDGIVQTGEECDDGGYCVGGPTFCFGGSKDGQTCDPTIPLTCGIRLAGTPDAAPDPECRGIHCTSNAQCGAGVCTPAGGDGCAVNCTTETSRDFLFSGAECDTGANVGNPCTAATALANCGVAPKCKAVGECKGGTRDGLKCRLSSVDPNFQCPSPGTCVVSSKSIVQLSFLQIPISPVTGRQTMVTGKPGPDGRIPVVIPAHSVKFDPVHLNGIACVCTRGRADPAVHGPGNSGSGFIYCGSAVATGINYDLSQDHNTNPGDTNNSGGRCQVIGGEAVSTVCHSNNDCPGSVCVGVDDATCTNQDAPAPTGSGRPACLEKKLQCFAGANDGKPCTKPADCPGGGCGVACNTNSGHPGVCNSPTIFRNTGTGPAGSALLLNTTGFGLLTADAGACTTDTSDPLKGPDGIPCTDDDPVQARGVAVTLPTTTGIASTNIIDANNTKAALVTAGPGFVTAVEGRPFSCSALMANPTGGVSGARFGNTFPALDQAQGDFVVSTSLQAR